MFGRVISYKIARFSLTKWKNITNKANTIYQKYGDVSFQRVVREEGDSLLVIEFECYPSKKEYERITKKINGDKRIKILFEKFERIVIGDIHRKEAGHDTVIELKI